MISTRGPGVAEAVLTIVGMEAQLSYGNERVEPEKRREVPVKARIDQGTLFPVGSGEVRRHEVRPVRRQGRLSV